MAGYVLSVDVGLDAFVWVFALWRECRRELKPLQYLAC